MLRVARYTLAAASITLTLAGCQDAAAPHDAASLLGTPPSMSSGMESSSLLIPRTVDPRTTDPDITWAPASDPQLAFHHIWLDPSARRNGKLLVFMPGTRNVPASWQHLGSEAARLGYYVIGLMYQNEVEVIGVCTGSPHRDCSGNMRWEILDGTDRSTFVNVTPANSIDNRLTKLLVYLDRQFPGEEWSRFLNHGEPKWSRIVISGQSQGAGEAALIGKLRHVSRVVMFSGPPDARVPEEADAWVSIGETPAAKYFALFHDHDRLVAGIRANLTAFDMERFGAPVQAELGEPPYSGTHILFTDLKPTLGYDAPNAPHQSTAKDNNTPIGPDDVPLLRDAWRYLLGEHEADEELADDHDEQDQLRVGHGAVSTQR